MKRLLTTALLALGLSALAPAVPAQAAGADVTTLVRWQGSQCLAVTQADSYNNTYTHTVCDPHDYVFGSYSLTEHNVWSGDTIGIDPIMGAATYIECTMWVNGVFEYFDKAVAGDGHDATCLRTKS